MRVLIKNGRVIDPANDFDDIADLLIIDGEIHKIGSNITYTAAEIINADGMVVAPGFIDIHTHLREPGFTGKETIETGCRAAVRGGYTTIAAMPNTSPVADNGTVLSFIKKKASAVNLCKVYPVAAITKGQEGKELAPMNELAGAGAVAFSDDGRPVEKASVMRLAAEYARLTNLPLISHCEDMSLAERGVMNEGEMSTRLGLKGIPAAAEEIMIAREIVLAKDTGTHFHIAHISTAGAVELIRSAKKAGIKITAEATPHHFSLTDTMLADFDPVYKVNPPLRRKEDVAAIIEGLKDGTIDAIATDHAPHIPDEKAFEFDIAPNGIAGLETALSVGLTYLCQPGHLSINQLLFLMSTGPGKVLSLPGGNLCVGKSADITIFDPEAKWVVNETNLATKAKRSPYHGQELAGIIKYVFVEGRLVHKGVE